MRFYDDEMIIERVITWIIILLTAVGILLMI
jgi:hypothetical protein